jgi:hypothetical protein
MQKGHSDMVSWCSRNLEDSQCRASKLVIGGWHAKEAKLADAEMLASITIRHTVYDLASNQNHLK